ncbi:hypothetical protein Bpro_1919 [Polaromonas sp. JS666]|nr:hypothetical protein Bpro_1919 [Polaromonas sp. JS666]
MPPSASRGQCWSVLTGEKMFDEVNAMPMNEVDSLISPVSAMEVEDSVAPTAATMKESLHDAGHAFLARAEKTDESDHADTGSDATVDPAIGGDAGADPVFDIKDDRPIVHYRTGYIRKALADAERHLAQTGSYFQRSGAIVAVRTDPATGETGVHDLSQPALAHALNGVASWRRFNQAKGTWTMDDAPDRICNLLLKTGVYGHLPVLAGLVRQPYLRPDGSICVASGHDPATGLYGVFEPTKFSVPDHPTREQAEQAVALLAELVNEFAFASEHDRSAALAAMLTAAVRPSLRLAPMFHVRAPQISAGKSFLCALVTAFATSSPGQPVGFPVSDEECTKLLLAELVRAPAVIEFDNLTSDLKPFKSLCTALTSERMQGRVLGKSRMLGVSTRVLLLSSGNNVGPTADMTRRCITINLDPGCETPATRSFRRPNLVADVIKDRERYVSAALTVVRAWVDAGRPMSACQSIASFGEWSDLCRQPLLWLGRPDPAHAVFEGMANDPDRELLGRVLAGWHAHFGSKPMLVREVVTRTSAGGLGSGLEDFYESLLDIAGERERVNTRKLGKWITRNAGRIVDGLRLVRAPKTRNAENWLVESVKSVVSVPSVAKAPSEDPHDHSAEASASCELSSLG